MAGGTASGGAGELSESYVEVGSAECPLLALCRH